MTSVEHYTPREKRKRRIRGKISGTSERPRISVFRSNKHIYAQLIDDEAEETILAAVDFELSDANSNKETAFKVGQLLAEKATKKGIKKAVFDRSGYKYHGRVKALAEGARDGGLEF